MKAEWVSALFAGLSVFAAGVAIVFENKLQSSNHKFTQEIERKNRQTAIVQVIYEAYDDGCEQKLASLDLVYDWFEQDLTLNEIRTAKSFLAIDADDQCKKSIDSKTRSPDEEEGTKWLVVFSTDPGLDFFTERSSAEFEVKLAREQLNKDTVVLKFGESYSTAIPYDKKDNAVKNLSTIRSKLRRSNAFVESLDTLCKGYDSPESRSFSSGNKKYDYKLYNC